MKKASRTLFVPLSLKIFTLTLLISIVVIVSLHQLLGRMMTTQQEQHLKSRQLEQTYNLLHNIKKDTIYYITMAKMFMQSSPVDQQSIQAFFQANPAILYIAEGEKAHRVNPSISSDEQASIRELALNLLRQHLLSLGIVKIENFSYLLANESLGLSYQNSLNDEQIFILINPSSLLSYLEDPTTSSSSQSFIVDIKGDTILHPSFDINQSKANYANFPIIRALLENHTQSNFIQQYNKDGRNLYLNSAIVDPQSNLLVVTTMAQPPFLERMFYRITVPFFFLYSTLMAILIYFLTRHLTGDLTLLSQALLAFKKGDYSPILLAPSNDEIGHLVQSVKALGLSLAQNGLQDDRTIVFSKKNFTKKDHHLPVATNESKNIAVLFTNIHSFTTVSKAMPSAELIEFLNDYTSRMTTCITATNGQLYTMLGDKIIAIWGMHSSMGNPSKGAIDAALLMRESLMSFNLKRTSSRMAAIKLGCGISVGAVVHRSLEAINTIQHLTGSAMALAPRLEALTKSFSVDIIASEPAFIQAGYYYHSQVLENIIMKGEQIPQKVYSIEGKKNDGSSLFNIKERLSNASKIDKLSLLTSKNESNIK